MSDQETVIEVNVESIIETITNAVEDVKETGDYLSYATLLDIHLSDPSKFTDEEKLLVVDTLITILKENEDILVEIAWDLPELILKYFDFDWNFEGGLHSFPNIAANMAVFDLLSRKANAKEMFLKAIELFETLDYSQLAGDDAKSERVLDIKLHILVELLSASIKRIRTLYPSKFLAMALSALLKSYVSYIPHTNSVKFIVRRFYIFIRDYVPPGRPHGFMEEHGLTQEEADKIEEDENYLQRTLLRSFTTNLFGLGTKNRSGNFAVELFVSLKSAYTGKLPSFLEGVLDEEYEYDDDSMTSTSLLFGRINTLMMSYDFIFDDEFERIKSDSMKLFSDIDVSEYNDDVLQKVLQITLTDKISQLYNHENEKIPQNEEGLLTACTSYVKQTAHTFPITFKEAIPLTLRFLSPGILSESFRNIGSIDVVIFWCWIAMIKSKPTDLQAIPKYQIMLFLQILLFYASILESQDARYVIITLLTRFVTMVDESTAYEFIINTLTGAPFENGKAAMVLILKDLTIRDRSVTATATVSDITKSLESSSISSTNVPQPPKLPSRKYIELNQSRVDDLYALTQQCIDDSFNEETGSISNPEIFKTLLNYINLVISHKLKFKQEDLKSIVDACEAKVEKYKSLKKMDTSLDIQQGANIDFLMKLGKISPLESFPLDVMIPTSSSFSLKIPPPDEPFQQPAETMNIAANVALLCDVVVRLSELDEAEIEPHQWALVYHHVAQGDSDVWSGRNVDLKTNQEVLLQDMRVCDDPLWRYHDTAPPVQAIDRLGADSNHRVCWIIDL
ncbi:hypothetical protein WICPIJ_009121 [Wickerhamomyces pijperi]|uniref:Uncharacterized protein n=1 Tax=Wickerhamomyces pijperi TaxID=599730 RepID=A0A9P8TFD7_WICPI|nr:hypothetical protein WICPIJ_009121 [Wickerhamomyces pijperi]